MRSDAIIIVGVGFQDPTQMHLAQDNDVVMQPDTSPSESNQSIKRPLRLAASLLFVIGNVIGSIKPGSSK